jgi:hypothetical protein
MASRSKSSPWSAGSLPQHQRQRAEIEVVSSQIGGGARGGAADFRFLQRRFDHAGGGERDFVLQLEHVLHRAVESVGPEMRAGHRVDQLARDA